MQKNSAEAAQEYLKLDYTIQSPEARNQLVKKIIDTLPAQKLTPKYLEILSNYIIFAMTKEEKKSKIINTDNRMVTINKRETSFEGLVNKFENGQDGIYNLITNDKNILLTPKISITQQDIAEIPALAQLRKSIKEVEKEEKKAKGKRKYLLKKQLIQMRQDQYIIKISFKQPIYYLNAAKNFYSMTFDNHIKVSATDGTIQDKGFVSLINPFHISILLCNYSRLKQQCYGKFYSDGYYLIKDLEDLIDQSIKEKHPLYFKILVYKIDGKSNLQIQKLIKQEFTIQHSIEYISFLWRQKIPKLIAKEAEKRYLQWYFTEKQYGKWKKCSRCGEIKLVHNIFFSKNNASKDGFYSICKDCRNKKTQSEKNKKILIIKKIPYIPQNNDKTS